MTTDGSRPGASGEVWGSQTVASGWQSGAAARGQSLGPATELMLDLAGIVAGSHVLDLGAGTGDQTLMAAERAGSDGMVLATDISATMLDLAQEAVRAAGLSNVHVQTRVMDAQQLDLESGSFDAVIARLSLQFVPDPELALSEARRVLKPGGRIAAMTWSVTEHNPYRADPQAIACRLAGRPFPEPGPGQWALRDAAALAAAFRQAGFREVDVQPVPVIWRFPSLEDALRNLEEAQPQIIRLLGELNETARAVARAEIRQVIEPFSGPDGFEAPGEALIAAGTA